MDVYCFKQNQRNVTEMYLNVIIEALRRNGYNIITLENCTWKSARCIPKDAYVVATELRDFMKLYFSGVRNYIYWYQGILPEEDYLRFHNCWRRYIFSQLERLSLQKCRFRIAVSKYLFQHYERKYGIKLDYDTLFVMPCYNSQINKEGFYTENKYKRNTFCYAGGLDVWQAFDRTVDVFARIEKKYPDAFFKVYSKQMSEAKKILESKGVKNYSVGYVQQSEMPRVLADCKFGFIIREDNIVNNVATPTKLGVYLGNGLIPVLNGTVCYFNDLSSKYKYMVNVDANDPCDALEPCLEAMNADDIYSEYSQLFSENYDREKYIVRMQDYLKL